MFETIPTKFTTGQRSQDALLATDGILDYFFKSFADRALGFFLPV
jgi:hypothetical protein